MNICQLVQRTANHWPMFDRQNFDCNNFIQSCDMHVSIASTMHKTPGNIYIDTPYECTD